MSTKDLLNKAAELMEKAEQGRQAAAELDGLKPALGKALARHEGKAVDLYVNYVWRTFLIRAGQLVPFEPPVKLYTAELDAQYEEEAPAEAVSA